MKTSHKLSSLLLAALAVCNAGAQTPEFKHIKSIPLGTLFDGANTLGLGTDAADVAFDGTNAYVVGYATGAGGSTGTHGVLKISNLLGSHAVDSGALIQVSGAGNNGMSMIEFANNALYVATGLMINNGETVTGIRKYSTAGALDATWAGDGVVSPSDCSSSTRLDAISVDPGFGGSPASIGVVARARGFLFRRDLATGVDNGNAQWASVINSNTWRDVAFDGNGNTWYRAQNDVLYAARIAASGNPAFDPMVSRVDLGSQENVNQNVAFVAGVPGLFDRFICYNDRSSGQTHVKVANADTGALISQLFGNENGIGSAYTNTLLNFKGIDVSGKTYLLVVNASASDRLDVYAVGKYAATTSFTVTEGEQFDGDLSSLSASDDNSLSVFNDATSLGAKIEFTGTSPTANPNCVEFTIEQRVDRPGLAFNTWLYNYQTASFVILGGGTATLTDITSSGSKEGSAYVGSGNQVRARVTWNPINDEDPSQDGWLHRVDLAQFFIQ